MPVQILKGLLMVDWPASSGLMSGLSSGLASSLGPWLKWRPWHPSLEDNTTGFRSSPHQSTRSFLAISQVRLYPTLNCEFLQPVMKSDDEFRVDVYSVMASW
jgi:hypothetical protein